MTPRILAFAGSLRRGSWNNMILRHAEEGATAAGAEVTHMNVRDLPLPLYDGDLEEEEGLPENAMEWKELFKSHHGMLMACPEYNSSITGAWKNLIDWVSRPIPTERDFEPFEGKVCSVMSASNGALGGLRGLIHVRAVLSNIQMIVLPEQVGVMRVKSLLDDNGRLTDPGIVARLERLGKNTADMIRLIYGTQPEPSRP